MVEPMSPRLASMTTRAPAARASSTDFSSTAIAARAEALEEGACGLSTATRLATAPHDGAAEALQTGHVVVH